MATACSCQCLARGKLQIVFYPDNIVTLCVIDGQENINIDLQKDEVIILQKELTQWLTTLKTS